jgi:hypothetical protein
MNTFWLKIAGAAVGVVLVLIIIGSFTSDNDQSAERDESSSEAPPKTVYDQFEEDDKRMDAMVNPPSEQSPPTEAATQLEQAVPAQTLAPAQPVQTKEPQFRELPITEQIEAERLWEMVKTERKMGRLPVMTYTKMIRYCRELIKRFPGTRYAYGAKQALAEVPDRYRKQNNITDEEIDLSKF